MASDSGSSSSSVKWLDDIVDRLEAAKPEGEIVCASGISPSGHIHLGNLREVLTAHFVTERLRQRGRDATHMHFWDDFDGLRKVPSDQPPQLAEFMGKPLSEIPDFTGQSSSYADRHIEEFLNGIAPLGVSMASIRQSERYQSGTYTALVRKAMEAREQIFNILDANRTPGHPQSEATSRENYYPLAPYCEEDASPTRVIHYDDATALATHACDVCGAEATISLADNAPLNGKLAWKIDWPMRWAFADVDFEPGGKDHANPGSSYDVGKEIATRVFGAHAPFFVGYEFVGLAGGDGKMSSSRGSAVTPETALKYLEPGLLRSLYLTRPNAAFDIDLSAKGVPKAYDRWDGVRRKAALTGTLKEFVELATRASVDGPDAVNARSRFSAIASTLDMVQGDSEKAIEVLAQTSPNALQIDVEELTSRAALANAFNADIVPTQDRLAVRDAPVVAASIEVSSENRKAIQMLITQIKKQQRSGLPWDNKALEDLVYALPKVARGLAPDAPATPELKAAHRDFCRDVYRLVLDKDRGPRLPMLVTTIEPTHLTNLLTPALGRSIDAPSVSF